MKYWISKYHGFLGLAAAVLIFGSWIITSTLQQSLDSYEKKLSSLAFEYRLSAYLDSLESLARDTNSIASNHARKAIYKLDLIEYSMKKDAKTEQTEETVSEQAISNQNSDFDFLERTAALRDGEVRYLYSAYVAANKRLELSVNHFFETLADIYPMYAYREEYEEFNSVINEVTSSLDKGKSEYESSTTSIFGPNWPISPVPVSQSEYDKFDDFQSDYAFQSTLGNLLLKEAKAKLLDIKKQFYRDMSVSRDDAAERLELVKAVSLWTYALGTLLASLAKLGEYYKEQKGY